MKSLLILACFATLAFAGEAPIKPADISKAKELTKEALNKIDFRDTVGWKLGLVAQDSGWDANGDIQLNTGLGLLSAGAEVQGGWHTRYASANGKVAYDMRNVHAEATVNSNGHVSGLVKVDEDFRF